MVRENEFKLTVTNASLPDDEELEEEASPQIALTEPITIQYLTELALTSGFPVLALIPHYMHIVDIIDKEITKNTAKLIG